MHVIKDAANLVKAHEGLELQVYTCPAGKLTIGYGRNLENTGITEIEADYLLSGDLVACVSDLEKFHFWDSLDAARQAALVDMRFNLGATGFRRFKQMLAALEIGDYTRASDEMMKSKWATQVKGRAVRLSRIMRSGDMP